MSQVQWTIRIGWIKRMRENLNKSFDNNSILRGLYLILVLIGIVGYPHWYIYIYQWLPENTLWGWLSRRFLFQWYIFIALPLDAIISDLLHWFEALRYILESYVYIYTYIHRSTKKLTNSQILLLTHAFRSMTNVITLRYNLFLLFFCVWLSHILVY